MKLRIYQWRNICDFITNKSDEIATKLMILSTPYELRRSCDKEWILDIYGVLSVIFVRIYRNKVYSVGCVSCVQQTHSGVGIKTRQLFFILVVISS